MATFVQTAGQLEALTSPHWSALNTSMNLYDRTQSYGAIIRSQPNVRTVISFLARNVAQLGVHLYDRLSDTNRVRVTDHPFAAAIRKPNPRDRTLTTYRLLHRTVWDIAAFDAAFWWFGNDPERPIVVPLRPDMMKIDGTLYPTGYRYTTGGREVSLQPDRVAYFRGSHNVDDPVAGLAPIEALRRVIAEDDAAGTYREQFWRSGARFSGWIERPVGAPEWRTQTRDRFAADWETNWSGRGGKTGGTPILEDGMTFHSVDGADARSAQYVEARRLSRSEAAALWHVDPIWVGIPEAGVSFASVRERHKALYQDTLGPWVVMLEQDLTQQVLPVFDDDPASKYVKLNIAEKLRGSVEETADSISKLTGRPVLTANEGRALLERNDMPEGDGLALPLAVTIVGSDAPTIETDARKPDKKSVQAFRSKAVGFTVSQHVAATRASVAAHRSMLERTFRRQHSAVSSTLGASGKAATAPTWWDAERWNTELADDLLGLALDVAAEYGLELADTMGATVDEARWEPYLAENARVAAESINGTTFEQLTAALGSDDVTAAVRNVLLVVGAARAAEIAQTRVTGVTNFVGRDVAGQGGRRSKVWVVTSQKSRHPQMDGETVPISGVFSNGLAWPGDSSGSAAETSGCQCMLTFE